MQLKQFAIENFKSYQERVEVGPLMDINVFHGPNNVGKSNLLQAMDSFFKMLKLALPESINQIHQKFLATQPKPDILKEAEEAISNLSGFPPWGSSPYIEQGSNLASDALTQLGYGLEMFNLWTPKPITWMARILLTEEELKRVGLKATAPTEEVEIAMELSRLPDHLRFRLLETRFIGDESLIERFSMKGPRLEQNLNLDRLRSFLAYLSQTFEGPSEQVIPQFRLINTRRRVRDEAADSPGDPIIPQSLRDQLFDAKEAQETSRRRCWQLFVEAFKDFEPELGPGEFVTTFDRSTGHADLAYATESVQIPVDLLGSGLQQMVALVGQLLVVPSPLVGIEEPELNLSYDLQQRLLEVFRHLIEKKDYGPQQLFLTSHSPAFDGEENFFAVDMQERRSVVTRRPREERFQATGGPPQTLEEMQAEYQQRREPEAWVSREGLVRLPERVRQDIGLRQGRMAYFVKNEQGRWELLTSDDMEKLFPREERE